MLRELRIENFAIIHRLSLSFSPGLNILTGETGAGKSIIVDALQLLMGGRASADQVRTGAEQAVVEAAWEFPKNSLLREFLVEQGLVQPDGPDEEELTLRRVISRSGKNRVLVNGHFLSLATLQQIGRDLVDIHGQHDQQSLFFPDCQLDLLDTYGGAESLRREYRSLFQQWMESVDELETARRLERERGDQREFLLYQIQEIRAVEPQPGEEKTLEQEREVLTHSHQLAEQAHEAYEILYESEGSVLDGAFRAGESLGKIEKLDPRFKETFTIWEAAVNQLKEVMGQLREYRDHVEHNPQRLQEIEERLYLIGRLKKKYGSDSEEILERLSRLEGELGSLEGVLERCARLEESCREQAEKVRVLAARLSRKRKAAAVRLEADLAGELGHLGLGKTELKVCVNFSEDDLGRRGGDQVGFLVTAQPGEEPLPLRRVASGGELSRMMLAIKSILAEADQIPVLVFDEIDAGIGGAVAEAVGRRLKDLSRRHQTFCITHLPQIAMMADVHYCVEKVPEGARTVTQVRRLNPSERVQEIARMLGGREITPLTVRHARELLHRSATY